MAYIELLEDKLEAVGKLEVEGPIVMVNLLRFRGEAGRASFEKYIELTRPLADNVGIQVKYAGAALMSVIGPEHWDLVALAEYPSRDALLSFVRHPEYQALAHYRNDGLEDSRLILTAAIPLESFPT